MEGITYDMVTTGEVTIKGDVVLSDLNILVGRDSRLVLTEGATITKSRVHLTGERSKVYLSPTGKFTYNHLTTIRTVEV